MEEITTRKSYAAQVVGDVWALVHGRRWRKTGFFTQGGKSNTGFANGRPMTLPITSNSNKCSRLARGLPIQPGADLLIFWFAVFTWNGLPPSSADLIRSKKNLEFSLLRTAKLFPSFLNRRILRRAQTARRKLHGGNNCPRNFWGPLTWHFPRFRLLESVMAKRGRRFETLSSNMLTGVGALMFWRCLSL